MVTFLIAAGAVALMMVGLSITLMRKGRNIQGDVGDNDKMKELGLECALKGELNKNCQNNETQGDSCAACTGQNECKK